MKSSDYIDKSRRDYSLYVLQMRAIPSLADGLKAGARRVLWTAKDGQKYKSATLAGRTMPLHPHAAPEGAINTLAAPYGNNIPLLEGYGAFGTLLRPTAYGASRYTSVKISKFTKDVLFADLELVPMVENYDGTLEEPKHFLPLVPVALINPSQGIAIGFATNILPRSLEDIIDVQIKVLQGQNRFNKTLWPIFDPTNSAAEESEETDNGNIAYYFSGFATTKGTSSAIVQSLPYGLSHEKFIDHLDSLKEKDVIIDYEDRSKNRYEIEIKFKKGQRNNIKEQLNLVSREIENLTLLGLDGKSVLTVPPTEAIKLFTEWRLGWYLQRYQRLYDNLINQIQKYKDILMAIQKNIARSARDINTRSDLLAFLDKCGIVYTDYIASLPVYRFTIEEAEKVHNKLAEAETLLKEYERLIKSEAERKKVYISELQEIKREFKKGYYDSKFK